MWVSIAMAVVAVGVLVWGLSKSSDLNSTQDQLDQNQSNQSDVIVSAKTAYNDVVAQLGLTNAQLDVTEQDAKDADAAANQAQKDADAAKQDAAQASDATEKAQAETKEAQAAQKEAESRLTVAGDCLKAYTSAVGSLFDGDGPKAQAPAVKQQLEGITAECRAAFGSS
jgi:chromosome segregation ATPase